MSITDELREWVTHHYTGWESKRVEGYAIADRIDAEHQKAIRELNNLADASVLLPVDADGVPIHVGDVMEGEKIGGGFGEPFEVVGYIMSNGELEPMDKYKSPRKRKYSHHHHEPTVEDVLREFFEEVGDGLHTLKAVDTQVIIAKYAAKLRLAGEK